MLFGSYSSQNSLNEDGCPDKEHFILGNDNFCCDIEKDGVYDKNGHVVTVTGSTFEERFRASSRRSYIAPNVCTTAPSKGFLPVGKCICNQGFDFKLRTDISKILRA